MRWVTRLRAGHEGVLRAVAAEHGRRMRAARRGWWLRLVVGVVGGLVVGGAGGVVVGWAAGR